MLSVLAMCPPLIDRYGSRVLVGVAEDGDEADGYGVIGAIVPDNCSEKPAALLFSHNTVFEAKALPMAPCEVLPSSGISTAPSRIKL